MRCETGGVAVGISGGVDSAAAAYILLESGFSPVVGVTVLTESNVDISDAAEVCAFLGIEHVTVDYTKQFDEKVISYFVGMYLSGRTPNPCAVCNPLVKFDALIATADSLGLEYVATGHYCGVGVVNGVHTVFASKTGDQSYALYGLSQSQLSRALTPLFGMDKAEVRTLAGRVGLPVADKPDSQDVCFIRDGDYAKFIAERATLPGPGDFVDETGAVIGRHKGVVHYTIGQRKGLGEAFNRHMYVKKIDPAKNEVTLCDGESLYSTTLRAENVNFMAMNGVNACAGFRAMAKIRYNQKPAPCTAFFDGERLTCGFDEPVRAVAPGQPCVLYDEAGYILCGGVIA